MKRDRIYLINCDKKLLKTILKGDDYLSKELNINVPDKWSEFGEEIFKYILEDANVQPSEWKWFIYLPIDTETKTLLGSCGFKGKPDDEGMVEIGYEVAKGYRNKGYATEIARQLVKAAFEDSRVKTVEAHTSTKNKASAKVLEKCNFKFIETYYDEDDGQIWKWVIEK